ncbi:erythromycin esterase family protein [Phenylobacterium sp.]|uniref:erythromycin esterase family protein n=1 Tax=Phenylobacterium sp. TaxID=1871053 RepID=UPI002C014BFC|nr:erythromycin esterase family protein [Phenylobacterium sp.]HVI32047.1 erythromycin esterase family protein [Phenylobacterium sp.]
MTASERPGEAPGGSSAARPAGRREARAFDESREIARLIADAATPLPEVDDVAFGRCFDAFADARVVLLGEASHGTSEFYRARAAITRWLIEQHGFSIVAVEADWPDAAVIDRYVRHRGRAAGDAEAFARFPTWMWRNREVQQFTEWLRDHNRMRREASRAGFYGLDLYNMSGSIRAVIDYLDRVDPEAAQVARARYGCILPWSQEPAVYGRVALTRGYAPCEAEVADMLKDMLARELAARDGDEVMDAAMNARLVQNAEAYYRVMYYGSEESWNLRDTHMFDTLEALLEAKGPDARAVVWAHNSHIGDARATGMGRERGELNLGQLCRQRWGEEARLIGFGTHTGRVACASDWDEPMEVKAVVPSRADSYERLAHDAGCARALIDLRPGQHDELRARLMAPRLERFIGVIYRPETERWSHYVECVLPEQFDAYVWFDETSPVTPLETRPLPDHETGAEETWPFGL